jgi:hypothetical protein
MWNERHVQILTQSKRVSSLRSPIGSVMQEVARRKAKKQEADPAA